MSLKILLGGISGQPLSLPADLLDPYADAIDAEVEYIRDRLGLDLTPPVFPDTDPQALWGPETLRDIGNLINDLAVNLDTARRDRLVSAARYHLAAQEPKKALESLERAFNQRPKTQN